MPYAGYRDPDARREYMRQWTHALIEKRKAASIKALGGKCVDCGSTENLEFDHKDPKHKRDRLSRMWTRKKAVVWAEVRKCELRCHDCHARRHAARGEPGPMEAAFEKKGGKV